MEKEIYDIWTEFINDPKYKKYFFSYKEIWYNILKNLKKFINKIKIDQAMVQNLKKKNF